MKEVSLEGFFMTKLFVLFIAAMLLEVSSAQAGGLVINFHMQQQGATNVQRDYSLTLYPKVVDLKTGETEEVYDFGNLHYYMADLAKHTIVSYPLFAFPFANQLEKERRVEDLYAAEHKTNPALNEADVKDVNIDMMFGSEKDTKTSDMIQTALSDGAAVFRAGNEELARFSASDVPVPPDLKASYAHFFRYGMSMHPVIEAAIARSPNVFKTLHFINNDQTSHTDFMLTMTSTQVTAANGPSLPAGTQIFTGNESLDAAIRTSAQPMKSQAELEQRISGYLQQKDYLRAALAAKEMQLMLGAGADTSMVGKQAVSASDPMTQATMSVINTAPATTSEFVQHMQLLNKAAAQAPDFDYLLELFRADQIRAVLQSRADLSAQEQQALSLAFNKLGDAITANAWLTAAYCDLGDAYYAAHAPKSAWILWEQAERLNPRYPALEHVLDMQQRAPKDFPEYF